MGKPDSSGKHLYILLALFIACTIIYYFGDLIDYFGWDTIRWDIWYTVHDPHRILFLIPILYCTYYYGLLGSLLANVSALLIFLPRALFISPYPDPALRMVIFVIFSTILSALMSLILIHRNKRRKSPDRIQTKYSTTPFALLLIFIFLSIGILIAGYLFYNNYEKNYRAQVENQLSAISDLKAGELIQWRKERIGDANMLYRNPAFSSLVQRYIEHPDDTAAQQQLRSWLYHYLYYGQYEKIMLLDNSGAVRIIIPATSEPVPHDISQNAASALQSGKLTISDLMLDDKTSLPRMELLIPVYRERDDGTPLGVVVLLIDPYRYLYPLISSWPTDSATAETLIVRQDGDDVLFLNSLKYQKDAALKLRIPLTGIDVPAVKAVLGEEGIVEGLDYRGVKVIADIRYIPDSPWYMVARIDASEVYAPLTHIFWLVTIIVSALLLGAASGVGLVWRLQSIRISQDRAQITDALKVSEERHKIIIDHSSDMIFTLNKDGNFLFVSPASYRILGYHPPEMLGRTLKSFIHPDDVPAVEQALKDFMETGRFIPELEYRIKHASGDWRWHSTGGNRVLDDDGSFLYFVGIAHDVTDRRLANEELQREKSFVESLIHTAQTIILLLDRKGHIVTFNPYLEQISGYRLDEVSGKEWFATFLPKEHQAKTRDIFLKAIDTIRTEGNIDEIVTKDGRIRIIEWYDTTLKDINGNVIGLLASGQDITDRQQAERKLQESENLYRTLVETSPDAIGLMDMNGTIITINRRALEIFGFDPTEDLRGRNIMDFVAPGNYESVLDNMARLQKDKVLRNWEIISYKKDGQPFYLDISSSLLPDNEGNPGSILAVFKDITERKKLEKALTDEALRRRILVEQSRDGIVILDQDGKVYESNKQFAAMLGYSPEEMSQLHVSDWEYQIPRERLLEMIRTVDETGDHFETQHRRKDGTTYAVEISTNAAFIEDQKLIFCVCRDITERKLAEEKLLQSYESVKKTLNDAINTMVKIVEMRDPYTAGHQQNVAALATAIAGEMKLDDIQIDRLRMAAVIHDIGKMYIPSDILSKPGKLSDIEYNLIKTHPQYGYDIVKDMDFHYSVAQAILQHHERQNGSGYPNGIKGDEMILEAKILVVADVVEAMAADRPYRAALGINKALEEIRSNSGKLYDPAVVEACLEIFSNGRFAFKSNRM